MAEAVSVSRVRWQRRIGRGALFVSYRRVDTRDISGRIADRLERRFGSRRVIQDVRSIPLGYDFRDYIRAVVPHCRAMLVVIGPRWAHDISASARSDDLLWLELQTAFAHGVRIMPLLVDGIEMPRPEALPEDVRKLSWLQAMPVREDPDFHRDLDRLIRAI